MYLNTIDHVFVFYIFCKSEILFQNTFQVMFHVTEEMLVLPNWIFLQFF